MSAQRERVERATAGDASVASPTLDQTVTVVAGHLPVSLVSPDAMRRVLALTRQLPAALTRFVYIECRLGASDEQVDVILNVTDDGKRILAGQNSMIQLSGRLRAHPAWQRVAEFCRRWADPASPLHAAVRSIWLEFDLDAAPGDVPVPGVFVRLEGGVDQPTRVPEAEKLALVRDAVLPVLLGRDVEPAMRSRLARCCGARPDGAQLSEVGVLLSRSDEWVRLCLKAIPTPALVPYLTAVGWPGDPHDLARVLATLAEPAVPGRRRAMAPGYLDLDIGAHVLPRLGLEYFLERGGRQLVRGVSERDWLDKLVAARLCAPAKRDGLLAWPGHAHARLAHELWPSLVVRQANHVKLVYAPGEPLAAKAYLNFLHRHHRRHTGGDAPWMHSSSAPPTSPPPS